MRMLFWLAIIGVFSIARQLPVNAAELDQVIRDIEGKWQGEIVRDPDSSDHPVIEIRFHCTSHVPDAVIEQLVAFPQLRKLGLVGGQSLTNEGLKHIGTLTSLEALELRNRKISAEGLSHLAKHSKLKSLFLWDLPLNKENGAALEGLQSLEKLELRTVMVSIEALESLKKLPRLKEIKGFRCGGALASEDEVRRILPNVKVRLSN